MTSNPIAYTPQQRAATAHEQTNGSQRNLANHTLLSPLQCHTNSGLSLSPSTSDACDNLSPAIYPLYDVGGLAMYPLRTPFTTTSTLKTIHVLMGPVSAP